MPVFSAQVLHTDNPSCHINKILQFWAVIIYKLNFYDAYKLVKIGSTLKRPVIQYMNLLRKKTRNFFRMIGEYRLVYK